MIRKLFIIIMGIFLVICAGACNIYPLYLQKMREKFGFSLNEVNLYGTFVNLGLWVAFPMGFVYDSLGPKISCFIGAVLLAGSYLTMHLLLNSDIVSISIAPFLLIALCMGQGSALCYTTSVTTNLKNFRFRESSVIVGLLVANLALSPSIFTTYRQAMKDKPTAEYFMIIAIFIFTVIVACGFAFENIKRVYSDEYRQKTYEKYKERKIIKFLVLLNIVILVFYTFGVIFNSLQDDSKIPLIFIYPCLQLLNFTVIILEHYKVFDKMYFKKFIDKMIIKQIRNGEGNRQKVDLAIVNRNECGRTLSLAPTNEENVQNFSQNGAAPEVEISEIYYPKVNSESDVDLDNNKKEAILSASEGVQLPDNDNVSNITFKQAVSSPDVLIVFTILVFGIGSVIANLNNIEFILTSILANGNEDAATNAELNKKSIYNYVILYFVFNSFTRIVSGLFLDYLIKIKKFFNYLVIISILGFLSQLLGVSMNKDMLLISISLAGATHGGYMTFTPVFVRNEFGLKHMGKILGFLTSGCALGSLLVADLVFIMFYEMYKSPSEVNTNAQCYGTRCFYPAYVITSMLLLFNVFLSMWVIKRRTVFQKQIEDVQDHIGKI